jgi:hypothetical protein
MFGPRGEEQAVRASIYEDVPDALKMKYITLAIDQIGMCLTDIANLQQQGIRPDNQAKIGGIAEGLRRAARFVEGKRSAR